MRTHIIIHVLPHEINLFEYQSFELRKNSKYLEKSDEIVIDATLNINKIDWSKSKIEKQYFIDRFEKIRTICDWATTTYFEIDDSDKCLGSNDKRRSAVKNFASSCDNFIYLDNDMFYPNTTLKYIIEAAKSIKNKYYVISPQSTKLWDDSWNVIVNDYYINLKVNDLRDIDPFEIYTTDYGDIEIIPLAGFKFGMGWFNMVSSNLSDYIKIPDSFGPYGIDDSFMMEACAIMKTLKMDVQQYVIKNLVVSQCYKFDFLSKIYLNQLSFDLSSNKHAVEDIKLSTYTNECLNFLEKCKQAIIHNIH